MTYIGGHLTLRGWEGVKSVLRISNCNKNRDICQTNFWSHSQEIYINLFPFFKTLKGTRHWFPWHLRGNWESCTILITTILVLFNKTTYLNQFCMYFWWLNISFSAKKDFRFLAWRNNCFVFLLLFKMWLVFFVYLSAVIQICLVFRWHLINGLFCMVFRSCRWIWILWGSFDLSNLTNNKQRQFWLNIDFFQTRQVGNLFQGLRKNWYEARPVKHLQINV